MVADKDGEYIKVDEAIKSMYSKLDLAYHNIALKLETSKESLFAGMPFFTTAKMHVIGGQAFSDIQYKGMLDAIKKYKMSKVMGVSASDILHAAMPEYVLLRGTTCSGYAQYDISEQLLKVMDEAKVMAETINLIDVFHS